MKKINDVDFELNKIRGQDSFITIGIRGGYIRKWYAKGNNDILTLSRASSIAFGVYVKSSFGEECTFNIGRNGIYFTIRKEDRECLCKLIECIFGQTAIEREFEKICEETIKLYRVLFSNPFTRSVLYITEFTDIRKQFVANDLARSVEQICYEDVDLYIKELVNAENAFIMLNGDYSDEEIGGIVRAVRNINKKGQRYLIAGLSSESVGVWDNFLVQHSGCKDLLAEYFIFHNEEMTLYDRYAYLLVLNELFLRGEGVISADIYDASIIYSNSDFDSINIDRIGLLTEDDIDIAIKKAAKRQVAVCSLTEKIGVYRGELYFSGIDNFKLANILSNSNSDEFIEFSKNADIETHNGAIVNIS